MKKITLLLALIFSVVNFTFSQQWVVVPSPSPSQTRNILRGVGFVSANDGWAVGVYDVEPSKSMAMHWDGSAWTQVNTPNPGSQYNELWSVRGFASNNVYAVGWSAGLPATPQMVALHWNGSSWNQLSTPTIQGGSAFETMLAFAPNDIYAAGYKAVGAPGPTTGTLVAHWNGSSWEVLNTPNQSQNRHNSITDMKGPSGDDIWAVGYSRRIGENFEAMVLHKTGSNWSVVPVPQPGTENFLRSITYISANDIWATGEQNSGSGYSPLFLHYNGSSWQVVNSPGGGWGTVHNAPNDIWSVSSSIVHYDGSTWSLVNAPIPPDGMMGASYRVSNDDIWAVGRYQDGPPLRNLIMHYQNSQVFTVSSGSINKPINDLGNTYDTLRVTQGLGITNYFIKDLNVTIDSIIHPNTGDLEIQLMHNGITDTLVYQAGGTGDNFIGTVLNDSASTHITGGSAPFTGQFKPSRPLSLFNNMNPSGEWVLKIYDRASGNTGTLRRWSLAFSVTDITAIDPAGNNIPREFALLQNYPNPFNPATQIKYLLPVGSLVTLKVFDVLGREVETLVQQHQNAGTYTAEWNANGFPSGVYFYSLSAGEFTKTMKMVLIK